jgi:hypothetical protein
MHNFFDCMKTGNTTISDPATHHRSVSACHLANIAMQLQRSLNFDPDTQKFVNDQEADAMLRRDQRPEYAIGA